MAGVWRTSWPNSFCCAPLHAVRFDSATATRCREVPELQAACAACFSGSFRRRILSTGSPPTALGGYRAWGCQVQRNAHQIGLTTRAQPARIRLPKCRQPPLLAVVLPAIAGRQRSLLTLSICTDGAPRASGFLSIGGRYAGQRAFGAFSSTTPCCQTV